MKSRFTGLDIMCVVKELQPLLGLRVNQIYDVDNKTYLIKFDKKIILLIESGKRIHTTQYNWPKNMTPSGFSMKLRKHLRNKRITCLKQLGFDRIVDIQFGSGEVAFHLILEMFDKGNLILTDHEKTIVSLLIPHTEGETRFAVREVYPTDRAIEKKDIDIEQLKLIINNGNPKDSLKKVLVIQIGYGLPLIEHVLMTAGIDINYKASEPLEDGQLDKLVAAFSETLLLLENAEQKGFIILRNEVNSENETVKIYQDFSPFLFKQYENKDFQTFDSFNEAIDEYFSQLEFQRQEMKNILTEKETIKKVDKIKENQASRLEDLKNKQVENRKKAELIMTNAELVDEAIKIIRMSIASQMSWTEINSRVTEAKRLNDPVAKCISKLKLNINTISMMLWDRYAETEDDATPMEVDIELNSSAHVNAKNYFNNKKMAALKEQKTLDSQNKAIKSAEKKARETIKDMKTQTSISKARKVLWFEKFYWCISSENYLIIGGKDQKQNEVIVKKYMGPGDIYVHADIHGASSIIVKNPTGEAVPPKTLSEAGMMAVCYSIGWESKILCSAWWVYSHQVSKTPPTGEYLTMGSFMVRGQKNYLLPTQLQMGFSFLFRIEESSLCRHVDERKVKPVEMLASDPESSELNPDENLPDTCAVEELAVSNSSESPSQELNEDHISDQEFPDNVLHFDIKTNLSEGENDDIEDDNDNDEEDDDIPGDEPIVHRSRVKTNQKTNTESNEKKDKTQSKMKRGQKGRQKKIKEKYKDQDEEDKELRMAVLKSAGQPNIEKKSRKKGAKETQKTEKKKEKPSVQVEKVPPVQPPSSLLTEEKPEDEEEDICEVSQEDVDVVNLLTGTPDPEDDLLYAIPVVGPYSAVVNYKYKVKLIPGAAKRGKAARSASEYFVRLKECIPREKDLIRSVKDDSLFRNLPGKVKLVIPQSKRK